MKHDHKPHAQEGEHGAEEHAHEDDGDGHEHDGHGHDEGGHQHGPKNFGRAFAIGIGVQTAFIIVEVIVGLSAKSLAVLADAGHNMSDVLALAVAWAASHLGKRGPTKGRTYGLRSSSILAALANALTLVFVNGAVAWEAIGRLQSPEPVAAVPMIVVSLGGVVVNGFCAWLFAKGSENDLNIRAAFLHLLSDAAVAAGVAITGVLIRFTALPWLDPVASLVVAAVVMVSTWSVLRRAMNLALHAVPLGIDEAKVDAFLRAQPNVVGVHDLHIWAMSTTETAMTVHLVLNAMPTDPFACTMDRKVRAKFKIHHVTVQLDPEGAPCILEGDDVV